MRLRWAQQSYITLQKHGVRKVPLHPPQNVCVFSRLCYQPPVLQLDMCTYEDLEHTVSLEELGDVATFLAGAIPQSTDTA